MDEVLRSAANLPNAFIRVAPNFREILQDNGSQRAAAFGQTYSYLSGLKQRVGDFTENVQLKLVIGSVSDAHGSGFLVAAEPRNGQLREPALTSYSVDDLHLLRTACNRADEPFAPRPSFV